MGLRQRSTEEAEGDMGLRQRSTEEAEGDLGLRQRNTEEAEGDAGLIQGSTEELKTIEHRTPTKTFYLSFGVEQRAHAVLTSLGDTVTTLLLFLIFLQRIPVSQKPALSTHLFHNNGRRPTVTLDVQVQYRQSVPLNWKSRP